MPKKKSKLVKVKSTVPKVQYTEQQVIDAIRATGGYLTHTAESLKCPLIELQKMIKASRSLQSVLFEVKESCLDIVESKLMKKIAEDENLLAMMFYLKCQGKARGWIDRPDSKAGQSSDKPLYIKIMPIEPLKDPDVKNKGGRPKKTFSEVKVLPAATPALTGDNIIDIDTN